MAKVVIVPRAGTEDHEGPGRVGNALEAAGEPNGGNVDAPWRFVAKADNIGRR